MIEMGRRFVPPPPPTNRPRMRSRGVSDPLLEPRVWITPHPEGRSRPVRRCLPAVRQLRCWRVVCVRTTWAFELSHSPSAW
jgi:hypothetical protein